MVVKDSLKAFATADERTILSVVGPVTRSHPFLAKTKAGKYATAFQLESGGQVGSLSSDNVVVKGGNTIPATLPKIEANVRNLRVPTICVNMTREKFAKICEYSPAAAELATSPKEDGNVVVYVPYVAFGSEAVLLHQSVFKGDSVFAVGELKRTNIGNLRSAPCLWVYDVRKTRSALRNTATGESVE